MPGIGELMEGAMQHAPQPGRQACAEALELALEIEAALTSAS
jgi:hypothetical protein